MTPIVYPYYVWLWPGWIIVSMLSLLAISMAALAAPRLLAGNPRSLVHLRLGMFTTAIAVVGISAILLWLVVSLLGYSVSLLTIALIIAVIGVAQWLMAPYIINLIYHVHEPGPELEWLKEKIDELSEQIGLGFKPKLVVAEMDAPNAFAYGSPLAGYYVAVTRGLLSIMPREEIVAVIGHELGHLKHRDVHVILALGLLPSIVYFVGRLLLDIGLVQGWSTSREREERAGPMVLLIVGAVLLIASILLHFLVRHFSRLREYYADAKSAILLRSAKPLQRALARLHVAYTRTPQFISSIHRQSLASMLFFVNFFYDVDSIVEELKRQETNPIIELFSTHPPIPKRLRFLDVVDELIRASTF